MLGAIIGDIAGSRFEWDNIKSKKFELFTDRCRPTDDSIMTLAVAQAILNCEGDPNRLGAEAAVCAVYLALHGSGIPEIRAHISENYYLLDFTLDEIRLDYSFDVSCQGSVPQAVTAFLESTGFEDALRNAISIGGDSDTIAAIAGGIAGAFYGVPEGLRNQALHFLDAGQLDILSRFEERIGK